MIDKDKFDELYKLDLGDDYMAKKLNISIEEIKEYRNNNNLDEGKRNSLLESPSIKLSQEQLEIITGTLLGDSSLQFTSNGVNPLFTTYHGEQQRDYMHHLEEKLKSLNSKYKEYTRLDKRDLKERITISVITSNNPEFKPLYNMLYDPNTKKKVITKEFLENFTIRSLAYLYMDDGYFCRSTARICTDSFDEQSRQNLIDHCIDNFDLSFTHEKHGSYYRLRLSTYDFKLFRYLIEPYVLDSLKYKLNR